MYNPWPNGQIPKYLQRQEPYMIRDSYPWVDPRDIIDIFEKKVAKFAGSKYAVAVDCCTHALELSMRYLIEIDRISIIDTVSIPNNTYLSVFMMLREIGFGVEFDKRRWSGIYQLGGTCVWDGAVRWKEGMYVGGGALQCLSFQIKKHICIGRGGMVLTDDKDAADMIRLMSYDGRDLNTPYDSEGHVKGYGYHYYMTPEDAARGILLMDAKERNAKDVSWENYPDIELMIKNI